jgi:hypothetical protein
MATKKESRLCLAFLFLITLIISSCAIENSRNPDTYGNPDNYKIYLLTGDSLDTKNVAVNGLTIDTSTIDSIDSSVQGIIDSTCKPNVVNEISDGSADYTIDYTQPANTVSDLYYGLDMQIESKQFLTMPKYKELVKNIKVNIIRFPGGQERVKYDKNASPDAVWKLGNSQDYQYLLTGTDVANFINLCKDLNVSAEPEVNIYNNDPIMAANFISQIFNDLGYDLKYISTGNEPDVNANSSWQYLEASNVNDALDHYMTRYKAYYDAIKAVKPDADFALCEQSDSGGGLTGNLERMLGQMDGKLPGAVSVHWYMLGDWGQSPSDSDYPSLGHMVIRNNNGHEIRHLSVVLDGMKQKRDAYAPNAKLFIGEWGVSWSAAARSANILDRLCTAIFNAEVLEYGKTLGFDSMEFFSISDPKNFDPWNPALIAVDNDNFYLRPQYYLYLFYKYLWGNKIVSIANGQNDDYSIYASKDDNYNYIMLINRTAGTKFQKLVKIITGQGTKYLKLTIYAKSVTVIRF